MRLRSTVRRLSQFVLAGALIALVRSQTPSEQAPLRFAILGDRTGEAQAGVFEQAWAEAAAERPAFVITTGDLIEGLNDATALAQWREFEAILQPYRRYPFYAVAGNHDIWSPVSERLFEQYAGHPPHYSFDYGKAHFTILDNSRSEELPPEETSFLESDLKAHAAQPLKFVFMHRPFWLIGVAAQNPDFALHRLVRQYGAQYVIAGHLHQLLRLELQGVTYLSMASSGGRLRGSEAYRDGWFFGYAMVEIKGAAVTWRVQELRPPHGQGRASRLTDWGMLGLTAGRKESSKTSP
jgi:predicted phosphodiesterase